MAVRVGGGECEHVCCGAVLHGAITARCTEAGAPVAAVIAFTTFVALSPSHGLLFGLALPTTVNSPQHSLSQGGCVQSGHDDDV